MHQWIVRTREDRGLSIAAHQSRDTNVRQDIHNALVRDNLGPAELENKFQHLLKEAAWYAVDVDQEIFSTFRLITVEKLNKVKSSCGDRQSLIWLVRKIDERLKVVQDVKTAMANGFFKSAALFNEGYALGGVTQEKLWKKMDQLFDSDSNLTKAVADAIFDGNRNPWVLLPFAERQYQGTASTSKVLEETCRQAQKKLNDVKSIDFSEMNDTELAKFRVLVDNVQLKHHALACKAEIKKRANAAKCSNLESYLKNRVSLLANSSDKTANANQPPFAESPFKGMAELAISNVTSQVIARLSPDIVLKLSKLTLTTVEDTRLINLANAQLAEPRVALLDDASLIEYLKLSNGDISEKARSQLLAEAKNRAETLFIARFKRLVTGLTSGSAHKLVCAVLEFSKLAECCAELESAAGMEDRSEDVPDDFSKKLSMLDEQTVQRARHLVLELQDRKQNVVADRFSWAIHKFRQDPLKPLTERNRQLLEKGIAQYLPIDGNMGSRSNDVQHDVTLGRKFKGLFDVYVLDEDIFRTSRSADGEELPVCKQFVKDQRSSYLQINGSPVFNCHIPSHPERAREFARKMRDEKGMSEKQIMAASRIANQSVAAVFVILAVNEKLFFLTKAEAQEANVSNDLVFFPAGLDHQENFVMNKDGTMTAYVRIFNDSVARLLSASEAVQTNPDESSVSAELKIEIDVDGEIQEVEMANLVFERKIVNSQV